MFTTIVRVLLPDAIDEIENPRLVYVLPATPELSHRSGDGMDTILAEDLQQVRDGGDCANLLRLAVDDGSSRPAELPAGAVPLEDIVGFWKQPTKVTPVQGDKTPHKKNLLALIFGISGRHRRLIELDPGLNTLA